MNEGSKAIIESRLNRAEEKLSIAGFAIEKQLWNSAASAFYYCCFNLIQALFAKFDLESKTHSGTKILFTKYFVSENKIEEKWGKLLARLFTYRQKGEYSDFDVEKEEILPLVNDVEEFRKRIYSLLEQELK